MIINLISEIKEKYDEIYFFLYKEEKMLIDKHFEKYVDFNNKVIEKKDFRFKNGEKISIVLEENNDLVELNIIGLGKKEKSDNFTLRTTIFKEQKGVIMISCRDEFKYILNKLLDKHLNFGLSTNDPKERCFIATVCYEDPNSIEVINLRKFRDIYLKKCIIGNLFIRIYYVISPYLSNIIYKNRIFKKITHTLFVRPIYQVINYMFKL